MSLLSKIAKTAAILVAAVFVLVLVIVGAFLGPPLHDAFKYVHQAEADGRIDARTWQEAGLPGPVGNALVTMEFAPQYHTFIPGFHSAPSAFVEIARLITNQHEHSIRRDFTDVFIIQILARKYRADQLVDDCARMTYFGRHTYGVEGAAQAWFGRPAARLSIGEAAFLVGVLKGPSNYDDIPRGTARRNLVLDRMHERGFIADAEWQAARTEALILRPAP